MSCRVASCRVWHEVWFEVKLRPTRQEVDKARFALSRGVMPMESDGGTDAGGRAPPLFAARWCRVVSWAPVSRGCWAAWCGGLGGTRGQNQGGGFFLAVSPERGAWRLYWSAPM